MKCIISLTMLLLTLTASAQTGNFKWPPRTDTFATNILAAAASFIKLAENPKKDIAFFTQDLVETTWKGAPVYTAPFPLPGFTANIRKTAVWRKDGLSDWVWQARFVQAPRGTKTEEIKALMTRVDSLLAYFKNHEKSIGANQISSIGASSNLGSYDGATEDFAQINIHFCKSSLATEQQAYDSLVALYIPLLKNSATARESASKLRYAFELEYIPQQMITEFFYKYTKELAYTNIEGSFALMLAAPFYIKSTELKALLTPEQQSEIQRIAQKVVDDYDDKMNRLTKGPETVAAEQKKQQTQKQLNKCDKIKSFENAYLFRTGITVRGRYINDAILGYVSAIDCEKQLVSVTVPGVKIYGADKVVKVSFSFFNSWSKNAEQYYLCSRCGGEGGEQVSRTETRTKEVPFGYFDGIITTVTRSKTTTSWWRCEKCNGTGAALEADRNPWNR